MVELVDTGDLKSLACKGVPVRVRLGAPGGFWIFDCGFQIGETRQFDGRDENPLVVLLIETSVPFISQNFRFHGFKLFICQHPAIAQVGDSFQLFDHGC